MGARLRRTVSAHTLQTLHMARSLAAYVGDPAGCYITVGQSAACWTSHALSGLVLWGSPTDADTDMVQGALAAGRSDGIRPCPMLVDLRRFTSVDLRVFLKLSRILMMCVDVHRAEDTRRALITPAGPAGEVVASLLVTARHGSTLRTFETVQEGLCWMGVQDPILLNDLELIPRIHSPGSSLLPALRGLLERNPGSTASELARALGMSQRTLQRRLRESFSSLQQEVTEAHLRIAKKLMTETTQPLKWIALEAGYGSPQHFSSAFRAQVGISPRRWRASVA
jgi:AraC-like DNA-binding protein